MVFAWRLWENEVITGSSRSLLTSGSLGHALSYNSVWIINSLLESKLNCDLAGVSACNQNGKRGFQEMYINFEGLSEGQTSISFAMISMQPTGHNVTDWNNQGTGSSIIGLCNRHEIPVLGPNNPCVYLESHRLILTTRFIPKLSSTEITGG